MVSGLSQQGFEKSLWDLYIESSYKKIFSMSKEMHFLTKRPVGNKS